MIYLRPTNPDTTQHHAVGENGALTLTNHMRAIPKGISKYFIFDSHPLSHSLDSESPKRCSLILVMG